MILSPLYIYALGGFIAGWIGNAFVTPHSAAEWTPKEHTTTMLICRKVCDNRVLSYDILSGECKCRPPTNKGR